MRQARPATYTTMMSESKAKNPHRILLLFACLMGVALNHSGVLFQLNMSLADPLLIMTAFGLLFARRFTAPPYVGIFFCAVAVISGLTAVVLTPEMFGTHAGSSILTDLIKMTVSLAYLMVGYGLASLQLHVATLRWFAIGAATVAFLGVAAEVTGIRILPDSAYYAGVRFRGFMVDPNYWAVLANSAIAYFAWDRGLRPLVRALLISLLVVSVLLSGSKTGLITLLVLCLVMLIRRAGNTRRRGEWTVLLAISAAAVALTWNSILEGLQQLVNENVGLLPQLQRVSTLLADPLGAVSQGGSSRAATWESGVTIIEASPVFGVGIGSYRAVNGALFGETTVAHNTYLQLAAEWGLPLALIFFGWIVIMLMRASSRDKRYGTADFGVIAVRNMVIAFLVGSMSLSLNNARMFWLFLGILVYLVQQRRVLLRGTAGGSLPEMRSNG